MKILLLAPHPFYQDRGTPIAVDLLLQAFSRRTDKVDVLTYREGEDKNYSPNIRIFRIASPRWIKNIRPGFSMKKLICDAYMFFQAVGMVEHNDYDLVHAVEESAFIARYIYRKLDIPYIFDMDSCMSRQIADKMPLAKPLLPLMRALERGAIRDAAAVLPMCDALADDARRCGAKQVEILRDISLLPASIFRKPGRGFREEENITGLTFLYIGNLEPYQGIDLLIHAFSRIAPDNPDASLVIAGGRPDDIAAYREKSRNIGMEGRIHFIGPRPLADMPALFADADILVSPRTQGENTPMKIYSYLDSGKPILATRLPTHTQVLNDDVALLVEPTPESMSKGMLHLLADSSLRHTLARSAKQLAEESYSLPVFEETLNRLYDRIQYPAAAPAS